MRITIKWSKCTRGYFSVRPTKIAVKVKLRIIPNDGGGYENIIVIHEINTNTKK